MISRTKRLLNKLRQCRSGNATLLVAAGMPMLIGGTGFAVDTAQWYMWKRELQFATDQAAVAAAWALSDNNTKDTYQTRGTQEYDANLATTVDFASNPTISLANFAGGTNNSVIVQASASKDLPFSGIVLGHATTVSVFSQAQFEAGATFTSCLIATDEHLDGAVTIGGNSVLTAGCGIAALSDSENSITVNGSPTIDAGWVISRGGIDQWFKDNTNDVILEHQSGLYDPFATLSAPNPSSAQVSRSYSCPKGKTTTTADVSISGTIHYDYYKGSNSNNAAKYGWISPKPDESYSSGPTNQVVTDGTTAGTTTTTSTTWTKISGNGGNSIWEVKTDTRTTTNANVVVTQGGSTASLQPGTYTDLKLKCDTVFTSGVYVIDGGDLDIASQYTVTGSGVMFVLKNGAGFKINGGSNINLTAPTVGELMNAGVSAEDASKLAGMLVFEDRDSNGNTGNKINGNAETVLNGTIYMSKSGIEFAGTASVTSQCLMIAAATITLTGTTNMTTFCPSGMTEDQTVATTKATVRLVA